MLYHINTDPFIKYAFNNMTDYGHFYFQKSSYLLLFSCYLFIYYYYFCAGFDLTPLKIHPPLPILIKFII